MNSGSPRTLGPELRPHPAGRSRSPWSWLLAIPLVAGVYPPLYNRIEPELFGIPFFYWYQLAIVPVGMIVTMTVLHLDRRRRPPAETAAPRIPRARTFGL